MRKKILVVDDEPAVVAAVQMILEEYDDLACEGVHDPDDAESLIAREFFPVILADLRMRSDDDGFRILEAVRRLSPRSRVVTITGYADADTVARLHASGAEKVLRKPLLDEELLTVVRELLTVVEEAAEEHSDDESLYTATVDRLCAIARGRYGFSIDEAQELVQETWLLFLEKREAIRNRRAWMFGTMANLCRQEIDRRVRAREHAVETRELSAAPPFDAVLTIRKSLASLDERSRMLCTLIGLEQHSYDEVSDALDLPIGSVGPLYIRAKQRLRRAVG